MWFLYVISFCIVGFFGFLFYIYFTDIDYEYENLLKRHNLPVNIIERYSGFILDSRILSSNFATGYGEITGKGMKEIENLATEFQMDSFYDIGCGTGKALLLAILMDFKRAVGIEIVPERYNIAVRMMKGLPKAMKERMHVHLGDYNNFKIAEKKPILVFVSNLLWSTEGNKDLFKYLLRIPQGSLIVISTVPDVLPDGFKKLKTVKTPMSWYHRSECHVIFRSSTENLKNRLKE